MFNLPRYTLQAKNAELESNMYESIHIVYLRINVQK